MRYAFLTIAILMANIVAFAQSTGLKTSGNSIDDIIPEGWERNVVEADFNKDGIQDFIVFTIPNFEENIIVREEDGYQKNCNTPIVAIYLGKTDNTFKLWKQRNDIIPENDDALTIEPSISVNDKGVITIKWSVFHTMGSWTNESYSQTYRFQNGGFYLIGEESNSFHRGTGENKTISINYLTHKKQILTSNGFDEKSKPREVWQNIPAKPLKKF